MQTMGKWQGKSWTVKGTLSTLAGFGSPSEADMDAADVALCGFAIAIAVAVCVAL